MGFFITFIIILTFAITLSILFKKRIEQVIPISVVLISIIIYIAGLFDNLYAGVNVVTILAFIQMLFIIVSIIKKDKENKVKELVQNILTPGLLIYTLLYVVNIFINQDRLFEDYDEFSHWAVIIKNMSMYNTYGTNAESVVRFNEYPPFTAVFQYLFVALQNIFKEDIIIIAQNVVYFSIIIPITKNINWDKSLKKLLTIMPLVIFLPMIFYENFFLEILVDAILGVMFAYTVYSAFEDEEDILFKYLKILAGIIMLCLTKTSGIALALLALIIIAIKVIINNRKNKNKLLRETIAITSVILITLILTVSWYVKVNNTEKRWDFNQYIETENGKQVILKEVSKSFWSAILLQQEITSRQFSVFNVVILFVCFYIFMARKLQNKEYNYYSIAMLISIIVYSIGLLITYSTIFDVSEAHILACFDRYMSTILLAYAIFQMITLTQYESIKYTRNILLVISIILALIPVANIEEKYVRGKNYIITSNINRDIYTKIKKYEDNLETTDKVLYIMGPKAKIEYLESLIEYEIMPLRIELSIAGHFKNQKNFELLAKKYDYVYIYRIKDEDVEAIRGLFENKEVKKDTLYKVNTENDKIMLEMVN